MISNKTCPHGEEARPFDRLRAAPSRAIAARNGLAAILRDARAERALLRMRSEVCGGTR
jgi:hypothetical protein